MSFQRLQTWPPSGISINAVRIRSVDSRSGSDIGASGFSSLSANSGVKPADNYEGIPFKEGRAVFRISNTAFEARMSFFNLGLKKELTTDVKASCNSLQQNIFKQEAP